MADADALKFETVLGHKQELRRNFGLLSLTGLGFIVANAWAATGGTIGISIVNGGPMAVLYGLIVATGFYILISASLSELVSSIPSAGGVYHWATVTGGPKWGRLTGWYAGWLNMSGWLLSAASISSILGNEIVSVYLMNYPGTLQRWYVFVAFEIILWSCVCIVIFANRFLPQINKIAMWISLFGWFISVMVLVITPKTHAPHRQVWREFHDYHHVAPGRPGLVFMIGLINAAFAVGTPDCQSHIAEEIQQPEKKVPQGIMMQMCISFSTAFIYLVALFYSIDDLDAVFAAGPESCTGVIYRQATGTVAGATGLYMVLFISTFPTLIGTLTTGGRLFWALARDGAAPASEFFRQINPRFISPMRSTIAVGCVTTCLGVLYVASASAFNSLVTSYIVLSSLSYLMAILPHVLTGRKHIVPGPFYLGKWGFVINIISIGYIIITVVIFCFPYSFPVTLQSMNWTSVIVGVMISLITMWWFVSGRGRYRGPKYFKEAAEALKVHQPGQVDAVVGDNVKTSEDGISSTSQEGRN
ncbi:amino acid/polyamine transporter I [Pyronema omphalodes]|nr:amino acid/polyamine transporter I [Pyronema omphalodes]